jgi:hypothetical protein
MWKRNTEPQNPKPVYTRRVGLRPANEVKIFTKEWRFNRSELGKCTSCFAGEKFFLFVYVWSWCIQDFIQWY